jgi:hypothetical protein
MLGILLIYFLGKYFFDLADKYDKNKWLYAILGVVSYYFGSIVIGGVVLALVDILVDLGINWDSNIGLSFMLLPFGIATSYLFYYLLKRNWRKSVVVATDEIQNIGKPQDDL